MGDSCGDSGNGASFFGDSRIFLSLCRRISLHFDNSQHQGGLLLQICLNLLNAVCERYGCLQFALRLFHIVAFNADKLHRTGNGGETAGNAAKHGKGAVKVRRVGRHVFYFLAGVNYGILQYRCLLRQFAVFFRPLLTLQPHKCQLPCILLDLCSQPFRGFGIISNVKLELSGGFLQPLHLFVDLPCLLLQLAPFLCGLTLGLRHVVEIDLVDGILGRKAVIAAFGGAVETCGQTVKLVGLLLAQVEFRKDSGIVAFGKNDFTDGLFQTVCLCGDLDGGLTPLFCCA